MSELILQRLRDKGDYPYPQLSVRSRFGRKVWLVIHRIAYEIGKHPRLFYPLARIGRYNQDKVVTRDTDVVVEGFPRSGNTFAATAFQLAQDRDLNIAYHCHRPCQIIRGARFEKPQLVLVRNPVESISSLLLRDPRISPRQAFRNYTDFYKAVWGHREAFTIAPFSEVVSDFGSCVERLNKRFESGFSVFQHSHANEKRCFEIIENRKQKSESNLMRSAPSEKRDEIKQELTASLRDADQLVSLRNEAESIYSRYLSRASTS